MSEGGAPLPWLSVCTLSVCADSSVLGSDISIIRSIEFPAPVSAQPDHANRTTLVANHILTLYELQIFAQLTRNADYGRPPRLGRARSDRSPGSCPMLPAPHGRARNNTSALGPPPAAALSCSTIWPDKLCYLRPRSTSLPVSSPAKLIAARAPAARSSWPDSCFHSRARALGRLARHSQSRRPSAGRTHRHRRTGDR